MVTELIVGFIGMFTKTIGFLTSCLTAMAFASPCTGTWNVVCHAGKTDSVNATGHLSMNSTTVSHSVDVNGRAEINKATIGSLDLNGRSDIANTHIPGDISAHGRVLLTHSTVSGPVHVIGRLDAINSIIKGNTHIIGFIDGTNTKLLGNLSILSNEAYFQNATLHNITFLKDENIWHEHKTLRLKNTTVKGNIVFEQGKGVVELFGKSSITGKVTGGNIIHKGM